MKFPWQNKKTVPTLSPREGYDRWSMSYDIESNPIKNLSNSLIENLLPDLTNKSFLDAGCGTGYFCQRAKEKGATSITGFDLSPKMIEVARDHCPFAKFICADISTEPLQKENYDIIVLALVLGHIREIQPVLENLTDALKPGGQLIISDFHPFLTLKNSKRTFKDASGKLFEIQHHLHFFQDIIQSLHRQNVFLELLKEPQWNGEPAIYVLSARKKQ